MSNGRGGAGKGQTAPENCPECGSPMWDNSSRPGKKPTAPDYVCKGHNGECNGAVWLRDREKNAVQGAAQGTGAPQAEHPLLLDSLWVACWKASGDILTESTNKETATSYTISDRIAITNALFEARSRHSKGILKVEKNYAEQKRAEAEKRRQEEERQRSQQHPAAQGGNDDLPF